MNIRLIIKIVLVVLIVGIGLLIFSNRFVETIIARSPKGEAVVSMGTGLHMLFSDKSSLTPPEGIRYEINVIEYRNSEGNTLARFEPRFAPNDYARAAWTDKFVLIASFLNGECPDLKILDRFTGVELDESSNDARELPSDLLKSYDPCGWGSDENQKWIKEEAAKKE